MQLYPHLSLNSAPYHYIIKWRRDKSCSLAQIISVVREEEFWHTLYYTYDELVMYI